MHGAQARRPVRRRLQDRGVSGQRGRGASTLPPSRLQEQRRQRRVERQVYIRRPRPRPTVTPASDRDPTDPAQARLQVLRPQVKVSSRGRPSVACSPPVTASLGRPASLLMGRSSRHTPRPTSHSRQPGTLWPRDSSERPRRQGRHPFFQVGGQP